MDRLSPRSISQSIGDNQIRDQRRQRQWSEVMTLREDLGLVGTEDCSVYLSNSALEKQCTRWLETQVDWRVDRQGAVRMDWGRCSADRSSPVVPSQIGLPWPDPALTDPALTDPAFAMMGDRLAACFMELGVESDRRVTVHWFNFCDPVLELPLAVLRPCLGAIVARDRPVWLFDRQAHWCIEYWPTDGAPDLRWGDWTRTNR